MRLTIYLNLCLCAAILLNVAPLAAQTAAPAARANLEFGNDYQLASWLIVDQQLEIAISQLAAEKSQNERVRALAQQLAADHSALLAQLERFAPADSKAASAPVANGQPTVGTSAPVVAAAPGPAFDLVSLKKSLGLAALKSARTKLDGKEGARFDRAYRAQALVAHREAIDTLTVFREKSSPALRQVIDAALPIVDNHLTQLEALTIDN